MDETEFSVILVRSFRVNFGGALFAAGFEEVPWEF